MTQMTKMKADVRTSMDFLPTRSEKYSTTVQVEIKFTMFWTSVTVLPSRHMLLKMVAEKPMRALIQRTEAFEDMQDKANEYKAKLAREEEEETNWARKAHEEA